MKQLLEYQNISQAPCLQRAEQLRWAGGTQTTPHSPEDKTPWSYSTDLGKERSPAQSDPRNVSENDTKRTMCSKLSHLPSLIHCTQNIHDSLEPAGW